MGCKIAAIAAMDQGRVIGADNKIPWKLPEDMQRFSELTSGDTVLMGRKTYQSLPRRYRPLPNRDNIVVTRNRLLMEAEEGIEICTDPLYLIECLKNGRRQLPSDTLWIIGGQQLYGLTRPYWDEVYLTIVAARYQGDAFFPEFEDQFEIVEEEKNEGFSFLRYRRLS